MWKVIYPDSMIITLNESFQIFPCLICARYFPLPTSFWHVGQVTIEFHVEKETNFIVLHSQDLNVTEKVSHTTQMIKNEKNK